MEELNKCRIRSARAHNSKYDKNAILLTKNYHDVTKLHLKNPGRENFDVLVLSSPTVDITNIDTNNKDAEQKVIKSCRNIVELANEALEENKHLKNVVIMEHPPRFDDKLRTQLARFANTTFNQLWASSLHKDKIVIGRHSLESPGVGRTHLQG